MRQRKKSRERFHFKQFCIDFNIEYSQATNREHWFQISCPFCGDSGKHGAFNLLSDVYSCWKCGRHTKAKLILALLGHKGPSLSSIFKKYTTNKTLAQKAREQNKKLILPDNLIELTKRQRNYLQNERGFSNVDALVEKYRLQGTDNYGELSHSIFIPIIFENEIVSWTTRATGNSGSRYMSAGEKQELIHHKDILFNWDNTEQDDFVIIVEGPFDAMKMGDGCVATLGLGYTKKQVKLLKTKERRFILFDKGEKEEERAEKLAVELWLFPGQTEIIKIEEDWYKDAGALTEEQALELKQKIIKGF